MQRNYAQQVDEETEKADLRSNSGQAPQIRNEDQISYSPNDGERNQQLNRESNFSQTDRLEASPVDFDGNELTHARSRRTQPTSPNNGMTTGPNMFSQRTEQNLRNLASSPTTTVAAQNSTLDNASSQAIMIGNINSYLTNYCINHLTSLTISAFILLSLGNHVPSIYLFIMLWIIDVISLGVVCKYRERGQALYAKIAEILLGALTKGLIVLYINGKISNITYPMLPYITFFMLRKLMYIMRKESCCRLLPTIELIVQLFVQTQIINLLIKFDGIITSQWKELFWPYWILFSVMIGVSFAVTLMLLTKLCNFMCCEINCIELKGTVWLVSFLVGITVISCALVLHALNFFEEFEKKQHTATLITTFFQQHGLRYFYRPLLAIAGYNAVSLSFTVLFFSDIRQYFAVASEQAEEEAEAQQQALPLTMAEQPKAKSQQSAFMDIPKFLMRSSSTYFKRVSESEYKAQRELLKKQITLKRISSQRARLRTNSFDYGYNIEPITINRGSDAGEMLSARENLLSVLSARSRDENPVASRLSSRGLIRKSVDLNLHEPVMNAIKNGIHRLSATALFANSHRILSARGAEAKSDEALDLEREGSQNQPKSVGDNADDHREPQEVEATAPLDSRRQGRLSDKKNSEDTAGFPETNQLELKTVRSTARDLAENRISLFHSFQTERKDLDGLLQAIEEEIKQDLTENALAIKTPGENEEKAVNTDKSVNQCLVCFDKPPDAVFMDCGHGGVCYECSLDVWKKTEECFLCRKKIRQVLQVDLNKPKTIPILKVISSTQMMTCEDDQNASQVAELGMENYFPPVQQGEVVTENPSNIEPAVDTV